MSSEDDKKRIEDLEDQVRARDLAIAALKGVHEKRMDDFAHRLQVIETDLRILKDAKKKDKKKKKYPWDDDDDLLKDSSLKKKVERLEDKLDAIDRPKATLFSSLKHAVGDWLKT